MWQLLRIKEMFTFVCLSATQHYLCHLYSIPSQAKTMFWRHASYREIVWNVVFENSCSKNIYSFISTSLFVFHRKISILNGWQRKHASTDWNLDNMRSRLRSPDIFHKINSWILQVLQTEKVCLYIDIYIKCLTLPAL